MKKSLPLLAFFSFFAFASFGQSCVPGANFVDSTYGVWPDTTQNFPPAAANVAYSTDLNFKVPATVTAELDASGQFVGLPFKVLRSPVFRVCQQDITMRAISQIALTTVEPTDAPIFGVLLPQPGHIPLQLKSMQRFLCPFFPDYRLHP